MAVFSAAFTCTSAVFLLVSLGVPAAFPIFYSSSRISFHFITPVLYLLQGAYFVVLAVKFLARIVDLIHSIVAVKKLQRLTVLGMSILLGNVFATIGMWLFVLGATVESYLALIACLNISGWFSQGASLLVPGHFEEQEVNTQMDYMWTNDVPAEDSHMLSEMGPTDSNVFYATVPLTALSSGEAGKPTQQSEMTLVAMSKDT
jgi:hypothetical protein